MIEINLLPEELRKPVAAKREAFNVAPKQLALGFLAIFVTVQILLTVFSLYKQGEAMFLRSSTAQMQAQHGDLMSVKQGAEASKKAIKQINTLTERKFEWYRLLNALSDCVTRGVWLRSLSIEQHEAAVVQGPKKKGASPDKNADTKVRVMKLTGSVVARGDETAYIGRFIGELKANELFTRLFDSIELSTINQKKIKETDVYDFTISCQFRSGLWEATA